MPNEKQYRYRFGTLNPSRPDEKTYADDNPTIERPMDRLQKLLKPESNTKHERTSFVGHVVRVINNAGIDDLTSSQRAKIQGNPRKIKMFIVRIPESYSAAIPEAVNIGSSKKKLDDIYTLLEGEISFIMENPDHPSPAIGDLVRCDYLIRDNPNEGGIIYDILGKQGARAKGMLTKDSKPSAKEASQTEGQESTPVVDERTETEIYEEKLLNSWITTAKSYLNKNYKGPKGKDNFPVNDFVTAVTFDFAKAQGPLSLFFNPLESSPNMSYYTSFAWIPQEQLIDPNAAFIKNPLSIGAVWYLTLVSFSFNEIHSLGTEVGHLKPGDVVNIWHFSENNRWVNSNAIVSEKVQSSNNYTYKLIGPQDWKTGISDSTVVEYEIEIKQDSKNVFSFCRL